MVYSHFDPVFSQVATDGATLYIADLADSRCWEGRQNKATDTYSDRCGITWNIN